MTTFRPTIRTQADLESAWRHLMSPLGFASRKVWIMLIDDTGTPVPHLVEIADLDDLPDATGLQNGAEFLRLLVDEVGVPAVRVAFLIARPGHDGVRPTDRDWAVSLSSSPAGRGCGASPCTWPPTPGWCRSRSTSSTRPDDFAHPIAGRDPGCGMQRGSRRDATACRHLSRPGRRRWRVHGTSRRWPTTSMLAHRVRRLLLTEEPVMPDRMHRSTACGRCQSADLQHVTPPGTRRRTTYCSRSFRRPAARAVAPRHVDSRARGQELTANLPAGAGLGR